MLIAGRQEVKTMQLKRCRYTTNSHVLLQCKKYFREPLDIAFRNLIIEVVRRSNLREFRDNKNTVKI